MLRLKLLLISLFTAMSLAGLTAQVNVHGTVSDANGVAQTGVNILVSAFYSDSSFYFESVFTGQDGTYGVEFPSPGLNVVGFIQVSMVDCWGTVVTQDFTVTNGISELVADFVYCEQILPDSCIVYIVEEWNPGALNTLSAWTPVNVPVDYNWSTGENTQTIFPLVEGEYCVTVTFPWGCEASSCYYYFPDSSAFCFTYIVSEPASDSTYNLTALSSGVAPFTYLWSTGETTESIFDVGYGTYCVTVEDANGCSYPTCVFLDDYNFCEVWISCDPGGALVAIGYGEPPLTYQWSTGETGETIYPNQPGLYCVTVTDQNQCSASSCFDFGGGFPDSCYVFVSPYYLDSFNVGLQAVTSTFGQSVSYLWNTGDTTEIIYPQDPNQSYCVTITDSNGCEASGCFDPSNWCYAWVDLQFIDSTTAQLNAITDPIFNWGNQNGATYVWSTGDTTATISVHESGEYCVTVTLSGACVTTACIYVDFSVLGTQCYAWISQFADSTGQWYAEVLAWGYGDFTYLWDNGETTSIIELESPNEFVCVTATNTFGCEVEACVDTFFNPCEVYININYIGQGTAVLEAYPWNGPAQGYTYVWSNGQTGPVLTVNEEGTYCVTVTGGGCISEACAEVLFWQVDSCGVWIEESPAQSGVLYTAQAWGVPPFTYLWSNGATEQSQIVDFGIHDLCVTITDAVGCVNYACNFDPNQNDTFNIISGYVYADSIFNLQGIATLYSINPGTGTYDLVATTEIVDWNFYYFSALPSGIYIVKAEILPNTPGYDEYMPTYHFSSPSWETADPIVVPSWLPVTNDIWMLPIDTTGGTGVIGGVLSSRQRFHAEENGEDRGGVGVPNVTILLKDADNNPLNYKISLQDGSFRFDGLPFGTYRLTYDIPGVHAPDVWVTLSAHNPEVLQVPLVVTEGETSVEEPDAVQLELYPNPAKENITINVPGENADYHIQVVDMQGRIIESGSVESKNGIMHIDVGQYAPGLYHINLKGETAYYFGRFVKQE